LAWVHIDPAHRLAQLSVTENGNAAGMICDGTGAGWNHDTNLDSGGGLDASQISSIMADQMVSAQRTAGGSLPTGNSL
jgi:hypothetical protein